MRIIGALPLGEALTVQQRNTLLVALGILLLIVIAGGVMLMVLRRRLTAAKAAENSADGGFSLAELRKMRDRGEITPEEYERTRARVVTKVKASLGAAAPGEEQGKAGGEQRPA